MANIIVLFCPFVRIALSGFSPNFFSLLLSAFYMPATGCVCVFRVRRARFFSFLFCFRPSSFCVFFYSSLVHHYLIFLSLLLLLFMRKSRTRSTHMRVYLAAQQQQQQRLI